MRDRNTPPPTTTTAATSVSTLFISDRGGGGGGGDSSRRESGLSFSAESFRTGDSEGADSAADLPPRATTAVIFRSGVRSEPESGHETAPSTPNSGRASSAAPDEDTSSPYSPRRPASFSDREGKRRFSFNLEIKCFRTYFLCLWREYFCSSMPRSADHP